MGEIIRVINGYSEFISIALIIFFIILLFLYISNRRRVKNLEKRLNIFLRGTDGANLEKLLKNYISDVELALNRVDDFRKQLDYAMKKVELSIKKVAIVRYNAFDEVGSDLSFSIALLDDNDDGIVITGIYGRNETTTYAKPLKNGTSTYKLSAEEIDVIEKAKRKAIF